LEAQKPGNGKRENTEAAIEPCGCMFCCENGEYWEKFGQLMNALAEMFTLCIESNHRSAYNWLATHTDAVFTAAREQMERQQKPERMH
jgi:hypothetical protein